MILSTFCGPRLFKNRFPGLPLLPLGLGEVLLDAPRRLGRSDLINPTGPLRECRKSNRDFPYILTSKSTLPHPHSAPAPNTLHKLKKLNTLARHFPYDFINILRSKTAPKSFSWTTPFAAWVGGGTFGRPRGLERFDLINRPRHGNFNSCPFKSSRST